MAKKTNEKNQKNKKEKQKFMEARKRADGTTEYIIKSSPSKTLLGRILVIAIIVGMIVLPVIALIVTLIQSL